MKTSVTEIKNLHGECDWLLSNFKVGCVDGRIPVMSSFGISCHNLSASFFLGAPGCSRRRAGVFEPSFHAHLWFHWMYMTAKVQPNEVDIFSLHFSIRISTFKIISTWRRWFWIQRILTTLRSLDRAKTVLSGGVSFLQAGENTTTCLVELWGSKLNPLWESI